ncbi:type III-B CRISPR-associated protein Cas10/Cmr2 [Rosettibacter firmus]|uniref:type III-B CRISPR-associated protein Cas10/Cmr2 n=1 Tax=Rosettibacter firmus TaxID=3111522 RepID=UPI00336C1D4B
MSENFQTLFGFTIGPIYEMMSNSKKTRELWFSSFFFSWYVKLLVKLLYNKLSTNSDITVLTPYFDPSKPPPKSKAGLFPDHVVGISKKSLDDTLSTISDINIEIKNNFIDIIDNAGKSDYLSGKSRSDVENIFNDYIQTNIVVLPANGIEKKHVIKTVEAHLDALERNRYFSLGKNETTCFRCKILPSTFNIKDNFDKKYEEQAVCPFCFIKFKCNTIADVITESSQPSNFHYRSTGEISGYELINYLIKKNKISYEKYLKEYDEISFEPYTEEGKKFRELFPNDFDQFKDYQKYMAIVVADGDNLGKMANDIEDPQKFSKTLFGFGQQAAIITEKEFHGEPVYLGGDDLLVFMPTAYKIENDIKTIFDYIQSISIKYTTELGKINLKGSISFGVHLFYYKSPLSIAIDEARKLLGEAKSQDGKNSLVLLLTQHSGQQIKVHFKLCTDQLKNYSEFLKGILKGEIKYPEGIHHNLLRYKKVLTNLTNPNQLDAFMKNRFNEDIHKEFSGIGNVFEMLKEILTYSDGSTLKIYRGEPAEILFDEFISRIKLIKFITGEK